MKTKNFILGMILLVGLLVGGSCQTNPTPIPVPTILTAAELAAEPEPTAELTAAPIATAEVYKITYGTCSIPKSITSEVEAAAFSAPITEEKECKVLEGNWGELWVKIKKIEGTKNIILLLHSNEEVTILTSATIEEKDKTVNLHHKGSWGYMKLTINNWLDDEIVATAFSYGYYRP